MGQLASVSAEAPPPGSHEQRAAPMAFSRIAGALALVAATVVGVVLTVVFAAALAVILVLVSFLVALAGVALRGRRRRMQATGDTVIEARKVGHSWVAYGWDQRPG